MGQPDVTDADIELETYLRRTMLTHGTYSTDDIRTRLAAHRQAAVAKREAEIVAWLKESAAQVPRTSERESIQAFIRLFAEPRICPR